MGRRTVKLNQVCSQDRQTIRAGEQNDLKYIGLETIESNSGQFIEGELSKTPEIPRANSFRFGKQHVLYGKLRPYLNKVALPDFEGKCSTEIIPLLPKDGLDRAYLAFFLRCPHIVSQITAKTAGSRMPRAEMDFVLNLEIPFPSSEEQRRIVDILSRAEGIIRLRREAQKKAAEIIPALFIDMFGDPAMNPRGWPELVVRDFVARFEGGKNVQAGENGASEFRILKVSAVTSGTYIEAEAKPAPASHMPPSSYIVRDGDLLFSRANTEQLVGATAFVESTNGKTLLPDKLWRFVWSQPVSPRYIHAIFQSASVRRELGKLSTGTSASMRNISQGKLFGLKLPIAPIGKQRKFEERVERIRSIQAQQVTATQKAEGVFEALLVRAFDQREAQ